MDTQGLKILLIDDNLIVLQRLQFLLGDLKHVSHTEAVMSAEEALTLLNHYAPDIMILDINMPGMTGIDMLRKMPEQIFLRPIVIMLTNTIFSGYRDECMRLGADYFLDKSRDFQQIPGIVEKIQMHKVITC